jgi:hypothetical protein
MAAIREITAKMKAGKVTVLCLKKQRRFIAEKCFIIRFEFG